MYLIERRNSLISHPSPDIRTNGTILVDLGSNSIKSPEGIFFQTTKTIDGYLHMVEKGIIDIFTNLIP